MEINGKYAKAKIFTDFVDDRAIEQIKTLCDQEFVSSSKIRIMPDVHAGAGCTIGTTMQIKDKIVPNLVGVDIGCGMLTYVLQETDVDLKKLDQCIYDKIPAGMVVRKTPHEFFGKVNLQDLRCLGEINQNRAMLSIGTLGGGNHFIEVDKDDDGILYLVIHSGSRYLGKQVAEYYQAEGYRALNYRTKKDIANMIVDLKKQGRAKEIQTTLEKMKTQVITNIPEALAYVEGQLFNDYICDMKIIQQYATYNRLAMAKEIIDTMGWHVIESFTTIHNYIDINAMILRKGAVSANKGEKLLIPINMRDGSLICVGKGNEDWNCSAPHGAGRAFSRKTAFHQFSMDEYKKQMEGIYTTSVNEETLDECPMAYKNMDVIVKNIEPTADIVKVIKPIYNFKAGETERIRK